MQKVFFHLTILSSLFIYGCGEDSNSSNTSSYNTSENSSSQGNTYAGSGSFCAYNYPKDACDLVCDDYNNYDDLTCNFYEGSGSGACGNYRYDNQYDYGYSQSDGAGAVGACIVGYNTSSSSNWDSSDYTSSNSNGISSDYTSSSLNGDSCWEAPDRCVSATASWSQYSEDTLTVRYTNHCGGRIYASFCNERKDGSEDCGASGIRDGETHSWTTYDATGEYSIRYIGVHDPSEDWVCSDW